jgi:hypothetical protein
MVEAVVEAATTVAGARLNNDPQETRLTWQYQPRDFSFRPFSIIELYMVILNREFNLVLRSHFAGVHSWEIWKREYKLQCMIYKHIIT